MKRNTTLTLIIMLSSVAAAVAAPDAPTHSMIDCDQQQVAAVAHPLAAPQRPAAVVAASDKGRADIHAAAPCDRDITEPYRRLHHGGMKLALNCADST